MNLIIDIGNTVAKLAVFDGDKMVEVLRGSNHSLDCLNILRHKYPITRGIVASVITLSNTIRRQLSEVDFEILELDWQTPTPVTNMYKSPQTLGMDRLAAVVGANYLLPNKDLLVIDAGTALTCEFIDAQGRYWGGNISPGIYVRFKALNACCDKLPLIDRRGDLPEFGYDTETAIRAGVIKGMEFEIAGYIRLMQKKHPDLLVFLTGGDKFSFDTNLKSIIFADRFLVLKGLTRYGLGDTFDYIFANNAAMGGVGYALRTSQHINPMNPASYTAVDSLSFMFDTGMTLKSSNYQEGNYKSNAKNSSFDYLAMQFRLHPRIATVIGYTPFSTVGYNFSRTKDIAGSDVAVTNNFYGDGDLRQIFGGVGFKILDNLSVGANVGYLYGKLNYQTTASLSNGGDQSIIYNKMDVSSYNLNFGLQYTRQLDKGHELTVGLAYGLGHVLNVTDTHGTQVTDGSTYSSVNEQSTENAYGIPHTFGAGLAWKYKNNLTVEADYTLQKWEGVKYGNSTGLYKNRSKIALGAEWLPKEFGRSYLARIKYRAGAYYSTPYVTTPSADPYGAWTDGPKEYGVSVGLGLPLNLYQRNSVLSITGQYVRVSPSASGLLSENRFVLKIGLTFNERWFMKWRVN